MCRNVPVSSRSGAITRSGTGPRGPSISSVRACGTNTGAGKIPSPSRRARRVSAGGTSLTAGIVVSRRSSSALNARVSSNSVAVSGAVISVASRKFGATESVHWRMARKDAGAVA